MAEQGMAFSQMPEGDVVSVEEKEISESANQYVSCLQNPDEAEGIVELAAWLQRIVAPS